VILRERGGIGVEPIRPLSQGDIMKEETHVAQSSDDLPIKVRRVATDDSMKGRELLKNQSSQSEEDTITSFSGRFGGGTVSKTVSEEKLKKSSKKR